MVKTVEGGALHIRFLDNTKLRLGSSSRLTLHPDGVNYVFSATDTTRRLLASDERVAAIGADLIAVQ